jgi:hypothetical protein
MRPRVSILNLLLLTTIIALVIVIIRLSGELAAEKDRRIQLLQKGGILEIGDANAVHVVQVSSPTEQNTLHWRVYVPAGRTVTLNARTDLVSADRALVPRLPRNAIVVPERAAPHPLLLGPGEHVVSLVSIPDDPIMRPVRENYVLKLDVVGDGPRNGKTLRSRDSDLRWFHYGYFRDITHVEITTKTAQELRDGRTLALPDGETFVLCRLRDHLSATESTEVILWLHPDE